MPLFKQVRLSQTLAFRCLLVRWKFGRANGLCFFQLNPTHYITCPIAPRLVAWSSASSELFISRVPKLKVFLCVDKFRHRSGRSTHIYSHLKTGRGPLVRDNFICLIEAIIYAHKSFIDYGRMLHDFTNGKIPSDGHLPRTHREKRHTLEVASPYCYYILLANLSHLDSSRGCSWQASGVPASGSE
jgi:hypothetical protein